MPNLRVWLLAAPLLSWAASARAVEVLAVGPYYAQFTDRGWVLLKRGRAPIIIKSYAGMFGRLPGGSVIYYVNTTRGLRVERRPGRLIIHNDGLRGVKMRREVALGPDGLELVHDFSVPPDVEGFIDTGFTLNPELTVKARVTYWPRAGAKPIRTKLGAGKGCLGYQTAFNKIVFESEWGALTVEFAGGKGWSARGALLNGAKSRRNAGAWVQVLPLEQRVNKGEQGVSRRSRCFIRFEPAKGKEYLPAERNLLYNGDFEDWTNPDLPDGWRRVPPATKETSTALAPDDAVRTHGRRSARWTEAKGALFHVTARSHYFAPVPPAPPCVFSIDMKADRPGVRVALVCGRARKTVVVGREWKRYSVTAEKGTRFDVRIEKRSPGALWLDAAQLEEGRAPTPFVPRDPRAVFSETPFPVDLLKKEISKLLASRPALAGCGPDLSYYTTETRGRLIYEVRSQGRDAGVVRVRLTDPAGRVVLEKAVSPSPAGRAVVEFDAAKLPVGRSTASAELRVDGRALARAQHAVVGLPPLKSGTEVKINRAARVLVRAGKPFIPVGSDAGSSVEGALRNIREQQANGFNVLHLWSGFYNWDQTPEGRVPRLNADKLRRILDAAHAAGLSVTVNLSHWLTINHGSRARWRRPSLSDDELLARALEVVRRFRSHPAVLTWHLCDEPSPSYCSPEWLERAYRAVKQADPYHPAEINVCVSGTHMFSYRKCSDLMSIDIYPVPRGHIGVVAPNTRVMRLAGGWRPIRWWIQAFPIVRETTAAEEVNMTYQALVEGARFILFYNHRPSSYAAWAGLGRLAREIRALAPALESERAAAVAVEAGAPRVIAVGRRAGRFVYVLAVNCDRRPVAARLRVEGVAPSAEGDALFEARRVRLEGSVLSDRFAPLARHVYRLPAAGDIP